VWVAALAGLKAPRWGATQCGALARRKRGDAAVRHHAVARSTLRHDHKESVAPRHALPVIKNKVAESPCGTVGGGLDLASSSHGHKEPVAITHTPPTAECRRSSKIPCGAVIVGDLNLTRSIKKKSVQGAARDSDKDAVTVCDSIPSIVARAGSVQPRDAIVGGGLDSVDQRLNRYGHKDARAVRDARPRILRRATSKYPGDAVSGGLDLVGKSIASHGHKGAVAPRHALPLVAKYAACFVLFVHVIPSGEVIARLPVPLCATATKVPLPNVTLIHSLLAALVRVVQVTPSGEFWT